MCAAVKPLLPSLAASLSGECGTMSVSCVNAATCLVRRGTGMAVGPAEGWLHSRAEAAAAAARAAGRTHKPPGRWCRRAVGPGGEVCCPPSLTSTCCVLNLSLYNFRATEKESIAAELLVFCCCETRLVDKNKRKQRKDAAQKGNFVPSLHAPTLSSEWQHNKPPDIYPKRPLQLVRVGVVYG